MRQALVSTEEALCANKRLDCIGQFVVLDLVKLLFRGKYLCE